jgi:hypothetical protein
MGKKRTKGTPAIHSEMKVTRAIALTDTAVTLLDQRAKELNLTRSELVEQIARGQATMQPDTSEPLAKKWMEFAPSLTPG